MTEMVMQRYRWEEKSSQGQCDREDNGEPVGKTPTETRRARIRERATDRNRDRKAERHTETEGREVVAQAEEGAGRDSPPAPPGGDGGHHALQTDGQTQPGEVERGRGGADARGSRAERGKAGPSGLREGEGSGGAGRARGAGRKRGGAAGRGPPEKRPNFLPRQSQEAGARTQGPGSPSPTSGAPPVISLRGHQVHRPWPRPASAPWLLRGAGGGGRGLRRCRQWRGLLGNPCARGRPSLGLSFPICQRGAKRTELIPAECPVGGVRHARPRSRLPTVPRRTDDHSHRTGGETEAQIAEPTRPRAHVVRPSGVGI